MYRITTTRHQHHHHCQRGILATSTWLLVLLAVTGVRGLEIKNLRVPTVVQSGTSDPLILDCDYVYEDREKIGLVVKWYRDTGSSENKTSQQVYQWIATFQPQDLGILKGRLNISYEASKDPYSRHRALHINKPDINLTGDYRCHVSSNYNDAYKSQKMVVYSPAKGDMWIKHSKPDSEHVNISCGAEGLYPEPSAEMIMTKGRKKTRNRVQDAVHVITHNDGLYTVTLSKTFKDDHLPAETTFECVLAVPETSYSIRKSIEYYPGSADATGNPGSMSDARSTKSPLKGEVSSSGASVHQQQQVWSTTTLVLSLVMTAFCNCCVWMKTVLV